MRRRLLCLLAALALAAPSAAQAPYPWPFTVLEAGVTGGAGCPLSPYAALSAELPLGGGSYLTPELSVAWAGACANARAALVLSQDAGATTLTLAGWAQAPLTGGAWDAGFRLSLRLSFGGDQ